METSTTNIKYPLGGRRSYPDKRNIKLASIGIRPSTSLPSVFSLRKFQSDVQFQNYNTCAGQAGRSLIEARLLRKGITDHISARGIYIACKQNDLYPDQEGTDPLTLVKTLRGIGAPENKDIPDIPLSSYSEYMTGLTDEVLQNADAHRIKG